MKTLWLFLAVAVVVGGAASPVRASEQAAPQGGPADPEAPGEDLMRMLTPQELEALIRQARPAVLARERKAVKREIEDGILFEPSKVDQALERLSADPADTPTDNIARITQAFSLVEPRLADPLAKAAAGDHVAAVTAVEAIINPEGTAYLDAVKLMCLGDALQAAGRNEQAIEAYGRIIGAMPNKVSFAAVAALRAAQTYDRMHRMLPAAKLYEWWLENYGFLDPEQAELLEAKVRRIRRDYARPLSTLAGKMTQVADRLAGGDSGKVTQGKGKEIVAMLDELIAMSEQADGGGGGGQSGSQGQSAGQSGTGPAGGKPTSGATDSALRGGNAPDPTGLAGIRPNDSTDAWGRLPIRQREKLVEMFKQKYPERYTEMLEAYYRKLSEQR